MLAEIPSLFDFRHRAPAPVVRLLPRPEPPHQTAQRPREAVRIAPGLAA